MVSGHPRTGTCTYTSTDAGTNTSPRTLLDITPDTRPITVACAHAGCSVASETLVLLHVRARVPRRVGGMGHSALLLVVAKTVVLAGLETGSRCGLVETDFLGGDFAAADVLSARGVALLSACRGERRTYEDLIDLLER